MTRSRRSPLYTRLQALLADTRAEAGLSQQELAVRLARPQSYVSKYESGERRLDVIEFIEVVEALGSEPIRIFGRLIEP